MFAALQVGAPFGYLQVLKMLSFVTLGNAIGGWGFVTVPRLLQVVRHGARAAQPGARPGAQGRVGLKAPDGARCRTPCLPGR